MISMRQDDSDEQLMESIAQGDREAFTVLARRYAPRAQAVAQRLLFNRTAAEDIVQDVFMKLWVHADQWDKRKAKFSTWFYRVLTNACIDSKRKKVPLPLDETMEIADTGISAEQRLIVGQKQAGVKRAIASLPVRQQVALSLCYYEGFSNKQAAEIMGVRLKALEALLMRARQSLRRTLAPMAQETIG